MVDIAGILLLFLLCKDDVMTVEDIDKVMAYGLGHRYAFLGVLETALLNAEGKPPACPL